MRRVICRCCVSFLILYLCCAQLILLCSGFHRLLLCYDRGSFLPRCCIICVDRWYYGCVHGNRSLRATGQRGESDLNTTQIPYSGSLFDDARLGYQSIHCSFFSLFDTNGILPLRYIIASPAWGTAMEDLHICTPQSSTFFNFCTYILSSLSSQLVSPIRTYNIDTWIHQMGNVPRHRKRMNKIRYWT